MNKDRLREQLQHDEGLRLKPYRDTVGKLTIGIGRNLDDVGVSEEECRLLFNNDVEKAIVQIKKLVPSFDTLNSIRQEVLVNMIFNMGFGALSGFHHFLTSVENGDFDTASRQMLESQWANQVGQRAIRLSQEMKSGESC